MLWPSIGVVSTHAYIIKRAAAVIFVMSDTNCGPQVEAAFTTKALTDGGPFMVVMWNMHNTQIALALELYIYHDRLGYIMIN
jgi:hypothetical protein